MSGLIAQAALLAWPVLTLALFLTLSTQRAIIWSLVGAYLLLPISVGFDFPGVPGLDKSSIPNLATFLIALGLARGASFRWPRSPIVNLLMLAYVVGPILTSLGNRDPIVIGDVYMPALTLYDALSACAGHVITLMPFLLGAAFLRDEKGHRELLLIFAIAALAYTVPILMEVAKGPFLQFKIYGVEFGGYYIQQVRGDGFRAVVFLGHGLLVSAFLAMAILAVLGFWKARQPVWGIPALLCALYLLAILVLNKSAGALIFALMLGLPLMLLKPRRFLGLAVALALVVSVYPALRASGLVPVQRIHDIAASYSQDRAHSLSVRLFNEDLLLDRARERPLFGWGGYNRNRVFIAEEWGTKDITITDGTWIITMGMYGWLGYIALFGLLCYPFLHLFRLRRQAVSPFTVALAAMLLFNLLDLIPNSSLRPLTWFIAGALAGGARLPRVRRQPASINTQPA